MSDKHELFYNGQKVGEVDHGLTPQERLVALSQLAKKAGVLAPPPTRVVRMFLHAEHFSDVAAQAHISILERNRTGRVPVAPFVVNGAFALELYLKMLSEFFGKRLAGHDLLKLFDRLPDGARTALQENLHQSRDFAQFSSLDEFRRHLSSYRDAFKDWRYVYEKDDGLMVDFRSFIGVNIVLAEACRSVLGPDSPPRRTL